MDAKVAGVCPECGTSYEVKAGDKYVCKCGKWSHDTNPDGAREPVTHGARAVSGADKDEFDAMSRNELTAAAKAAGVTGAIKMKTADIASALRAAASASDAPDAGETTVITDPALGENDASGQALVP
jgi:hypothetical protein